MAHAPFVHLRVHSAYSLSEGAIKLKELVGLCRKLAMPAVAVTDSTNLFGALEFASYATEAGIQPIIGCKLALRRENGEKRHAAGNGNGHAPPPDALVLLVQSDAGWANLVKLVSKAHLETSPGEPPQVALGDLEGRTEGLLALTGGPAGTVGRLLAEGQGPAAEAVLGQLSHLFPDRLYVELMRHGLPAERRSEAPLIQLADTAGLPLVATNDVYFADAGMAEAHEALLSIAKGTLLSDPERPRLTPEHRFKSAAEMQALFADLPEAIDNTLAVARRCAFMPEKRKPILPAFPTEDGRSEIDQLRAEAEAGLGKHLRQVPEDQHHAYRDRLEFELGVITGMGFAGYYLIVADFVRFAKRSGIPVGIRGSGAASAVAWSLNITDLDPLRFRLVFERFLNPERISMPDFDIDFCQDRRDEVIRYVQDKYGHDRVAQIITFGKLQARAALRDVGRVMELPYGQVDRICKLVPNNPANPITLARAIESEPELQRQRDQDESVRRLLSVALKLEGLYRHASTHAAGIVIGDRPLDELVPLYRDPRSDMLVSQFNMKWVEPAGLVKFDFLGLKTLTVLAETVKLVAKRGIDIDLAALGFEDEAAFALLGRGETVGVFQLESAGMRDLVRQMKPDRIEDIIALVALYRPGPMESIPSYINRKRGTEQPDYLHPLLKPVLEETYGVITYQEHVMEIAKVLAGYSLGEADILRRAMGKKVKEEMDAQRERFLSGATQQGVPPAQAEHIFELMNKFAGYGFNKSHAATYAQVAYQTAYLKANYPVEFFAATMTLDLGNTDKLNGYRQELSRLGVKLLPPDLNRSDAVFAVEQLPDGKSAIRYALAAVRNVGRQAMTALVAERKERGPFRDLADLAQRIDAKTLIKRQLENLVAAGACDGLNPNRAQAYKAVDLILRHASAAASDKDTSQTSLFAGADAPAARLSLPLETEWPTMEQLKYEFDAIGFYLSAHPLDAYGASLERIGIVRSSELGQRVAHESARLKLAGIVIAKQERTSARTSNRYAFVSFSDQTGVFEVTLFSEILAQSRPLLESGTPLLVTLDARAEGDGVKLTAHKIEPLDAAVAHAAQGLKIYLRDPKPLPAIRGVMQRAKQGRGRVRLVLDAGGAEVEVALPGLYAIGAETRGAVKAVPGVIEVRDL
ncbi:MAG: DNA polymerase III subunit alpha [Proteobacteria bacterium]|nr:DNA polymerase III subunit alpha [Pseudomonadota bacterium]